MLDLSGKTPAEARAALEAAGFVVVSGEENVDDLCGEGEDHAMTRQGGICKQTPMAGTAIDAGAVRLRYTIEHDAYEHGGDGGANPWRRMPDVTGKPLSEADRVLASAQLGLARHFELVDAGDACAAEVVCEQYPRARERMFVKRPGRLYVGSARAAPPPSAAATPPQPPAAASQPTAKPDTYF